MHPQLISMNHTRHPQYNWNIYESTRKPVMLLNRAWKNRLSSHGTAASPARLTTFLSGPGPFYGTQHVSRSKTLNLMTEWLLVIRGAREVERAGKREFCSIEVVLGCCMILSTLSLVTLWNNFFSMASVATREDGEVGAAVENDAGEEVLYNAQGKKKGKHDKPKPWDTPDIDHWKLERFDPSWNEGGMLEESSFSTLFPQYRGSLSLSLSLSPVFGGAVWWKLAD